MRVADLVDWHTAICHVGTSPLAAGTIVLLGLASVALVFIRVILTIIASICKKNVRQQMRMKIFLLTANPRFEDASRVVALEVVSRTLHLAASGRLVAAVFTVGVEIAVPGLGNANFRGLALKLLLAVALVRRQCRAVFLIGAITCNAGTSC